MADNVHRKSHKLSDGSRKISNPVHRTTTETIRLGEPDKLHQPVSLTTSSNVTSSNQCRKKTSSFQITSVTVGCRMSNDAGEDSNDDLDESHTEDNSVEHSRITDIDIETPSYSEDTFSKEDVFFNTSNAALSTAPVIPTSSQYGLAIVPSEGNSVNNSVNDSNINTLDITSVTDNNIINLLSSNAKQDSDLREVHSHGRNERFKVVKIESTEPFKRGRWTCMDYLDHTSVNQPTAIGTPKVSDPNEVCISYGITDSGIVIPDASKQSVVSDDKSISLDANGTVPSHPDVHSSIGVPNNPTVTSANYAVNSSIPPTVQHNPTQVQTQAKVQPPSQIPQYFQSSAQQLASQPQGQGSTLPSNLQPTHPNNLGQPQSMPQGSIPIITQTSSNSVPPQQNMTHSKEDPYLGVSTQNQSLPGQTVCPSSVQQTSVPTSQAPNILVTQHPPQQQQQPQQSQHPPQQQQQQPQQQQQTQHPPQQQQQQQSQQPLQTQKPMTQISEPLTAVQGMQGIQSPPVQPQVMPATQMQTQSSGSNTQVQMAQVPAACQNVVAGIQQGTITFHQPDPEQDSISGIVTTAATQSADATLLESLTEVTQGSDEHHTLEDNESVSGTSAVAIDNKIEQAMDLVKSHLMFAVREEVEVLKEKIAELMDRINQLEAENSILKAHATPETLAQLSQTTAKLPQNSSGSGQ
ncbi:hypothetical protein HZH66_008112 [Vespula vulgaris]|uniref:TSC22 domain family protein 1 n=1 Tax=Vespula vulgaris TaxID=7454 RepID=A0A834N5C9_VESVU|nr:hypothetical protein HZH66_008112 [Vespula vulgaris]